MKDKYGANERREGTTTASRLRALVAAQEMFQRYATLRALM